MWKLRPGWFADWDQRGVVVRSDVRRFRLTSDFLSPERIAVALSAGTFPPECEGEGDASIAAERLLEELVQLKVVVCVQGQPKPFLNQRSPQAEYFLHLGLDQDEAAARIAGSKVLFLGVGGLGSVVLQHLVAAGVRRMTLVDDDVVEESNLERQLIYSLRDIGQLKTDSSLPYVLDRSPAAEISIKSRTIVSRSDVETLLSETGTPQLCIVCIDRPLETSFEAVVGALWTAGVPCIHGGTMIRSGFYGPLFDRNVSKYSPDFFLFPQGENRRPMTPLGIAFGPHNTTIAAAIAAECLHYLVGAAELVSFHERTFMDLFRGHSIKMPPVTPKQSRG